MFLAAPRIVLLQRRILEAIGANRTCCNALASVATGALHRAAADTQPGRNQQLLARRRGPPRRIGAVAWGHTSNSRMDCAANYEIPRCLLRDRDAIYGAVVTRRLRAMGIRDKPIAAGVNKIIDLP
jgi:hypothetical protein